MKNQKFNLLFSYITLFIALGVFFPFHSIYLQESLNYSPNQIGLLYSLSALIVIISVPIAGLMADRLRNPGLIYLLCALATAVFLIPYSFLKPFSIMLIIFIFVNGLRSCLIPLLDTIALDYTYKTKQNFGLYRAAGSFSFILAAIFMGYMLDVFQAYPNLFLYIQMVALILSGYFIAKQDNLYIENSPKSLALEDIKILLKNKKYLLVINVMALAYGIIQVSQAYLSLSIIELGGSNNIVGFSFLFLVIPEVLLFGFIAKLLNKYLHTSLMMFALVFLLFRWIILLVTNSLTVLLLVSLTHGLIMALVILVGMDYIKQIVLPSLLASAIAIFTGLSNLYFAIISLFVGFSATEITYKNTYYVYTIATALAIIILLWIIYYQKKDVRYDEW